MRLSPSQAERIGGPVLSLLAKSLRWYYIGHEEFVKEIEARGIILSFWHNRILGACLLPLFRRYRTITLISQHRDGEIITRLAARFGHETERGSTGAGKGGLAALFRLGEQAGPGRLLAITPDGPQGPRYCVQKGVAILARKTGLAVAPFVPAYAARFLMNSWDRFEVPAPLAKAHAHFGPLIRVGEDEEIEAARLRIERGMRLATEAAEAFFGRRPEYPETAGGPDS